MKLVDIMTKTEYIIGVDVGGTWTRALLLDKSNNETEKIKEQVDIRNDMAISEQIIKMIQTLCHRHNVTTSSLKGVGIASAGPLDVKEGVLVRPTNLPFEHVSLVKPIKEKLNVPVFLVNDCTAAVLGEKEFGGGKGISNLFYVTISTGIGGGAIVDDHLLMGKDGNAVEIGHFTIDYQGKLLCGCGRRGHWEAYCSGRNIPNYVELRMREMRKGALENSLIFDKIGGDLSMLSSEILFAAAKMGDSWSLEIVEEIGVLNAIGFANIVNAYDPALILVGGTVALKNTELIMPPIKKHIAEYALNRIPEIEITPLGDDVGVYGGIAAVIRFTAHSR